VRRGFRKYGPAGCSESRTQQLSRKLLALTASGTQMRIFELAMETR